MPLTSLRRAVATAAALTTGFAVLALPGTGATAGATPSTCASAMTALGLAPHLAPDGIETMYSGKVPSWDGVPLDVDVTVPSPDACELPLLTFGHGWGNSKADWESAGASSSNPNHDHFNNISFAQRGYAVLTFTNRGWHGSCGPDVSSDHTPAGLPAACTANGRQYWIHLSDARYEMRDAQWLMGLLVDAGQANPQHLGVAGGSLGGGLAWLLTVLHDRTMCGGQGWAASPLADPCAGQADGALVPWLSPGGRRLRIAAATPEYTWATLVNALVPNGRAGDGTSAAFPASGTNPASPIGIPIQSYVSGLFADGEPLGNGFYQPPTSTDGTANLPLWFAAISAAPNTVNTQDPTYGGIVNAALDQLARFKSPLSSLIPVDGDVPVLQIQGLTDPLFKPVEAELIRAKMAAFDPSYPLATVYGDVGHSYADNPADVWAAFNTRANAFLDYYLLGSGTPPVFDVSASLTRCVPAQSTPTPTFYSGPTLASLATGSVTYTSTAPGLSSSAAGGQESVATDPITHSGCRSMPTTTDPGVASWTFTPASAQTLLGSPAVQASVTPDGPDTEVIARLWDVSPLGTQTLVSRGAYRLAATPGSAQTVAMQLSANGWALPATDSWKLEIMGADAPTYQADTLPSTAVVSNVALTLPLR